MELIAEGPTNGYSPQSGHDAAGTLTLKLTATTGGKMRLDANATKRIYEHIPADSKLWLQPNDILIQRANTLEHVGTAAIYDGPPATYIYPDLMMRVRVTGAVIPSFLCLYLNTDAPRTFLRDRATGTAGNMPKVSGSTVRAIPVHLAPIPEQRRIVAKLEALTAKSDRAKTALEAIPPLFDRLRQSVLSAAFRGDLTAAWRAKNPDVEPAEELLKRIGAERRRRWEEAELAQMRAKGKVPGNDRWKEKYEEPAPVDASELPKLPEGWCWARLEELRAPDAPIVYGIIQPGDDVPGGVPYVRPIDMTNDGGIDFTSIKRTSDEIAKQYERASIKTGDVILSIVGTIGKVVITPAALNGGNITQSSVRIRTPDGMPWNYMRFALLSPQLRKQYDRFRFGNAVQRLNVEHVRDLVVPLAPTAEQRELTSRLESALQRVPNGLIRALQERFYDMERAILAKAFRGELVPQDPNDEPASDLLARIRSGRGIASGAGKPTRTKGTRAPRSQIKAEIVMLTRKDVTKSYLSGILKDRGPLTAEALWNASQLQIDDFYDQLKEEEARGLLREKRGDSASAPRILEART
ncbi:restriction endonuclease subunit S [Sorangium sp. So ce1153]|uniref:restriction endonuclease subunit S n=1 Tax=Sorangium sp. So ce1153 TaxID=3133333 RepID=UPI003F623DAC